MDKTIKFKEAFKIALAFALVYGIALKVNWLSPSWAGWSVVAIAATSGGESLQKGLLRTGGTILACVIGLTIISVAAQNRWTFMLLTAGWLFYSSYKMLANKEHSYFWFCAAYVTLVITAAGPSSAGGFYIAIFRTIETIMGIVVYTLIAIFLWPRSNIGSVKKALSELLGTQTILIQNIYEVFCGNYQLKQLKELAQLQVKQLGQYAQSLSSEGAENYYVQELNPLLCRFKDLNDSLLKSLDRLFGGIEDLSKMNIINSRAEIDDFFTELYHRFTGMSALISGKSFDIKMQDINLKVNSLDRQDISHFDKAALAIILAELNKIESITRKMVNLATQIANPSASDQDNQIEEVKPKRKKRFFFPVFDIEYLKGSFYVAMTIVFGFIIWFYVNPPGHSTWYIMGGVFALIFAGAQQVKTIKLIIPFVLAMILASLVYIFVLPELSSFYQLGLLLFACMFVVQFFLSGPATAIFNIFILQIIVINNPQTYDASALLNSFVFIPMMMIYLFGMSYLINSPRPEKAFLRLVSRFFRSTKFLVAQQNINPKVASSLHRYQIAYYQYELNTLPEKIRAWGKAIDKKLFPSTETEQIEALVNTLNVLLVRMETLMEANSRTQDNNHIELTEILSGWKQKLINSFDNWDNIVNEEIKTNTSELVLKKIDELEEKMKEIEAKNEDEINIEEGIRFYHVLGSYRGVTEATLSFVSVADQLDWKQLKEERFQ